MQTPKFTLTINSDDPGEISRCLAAIGGVPAGGMTGGLSAALMAPAAPAPQADDENGPINTSAPATDTAGLPWDERIHSANKALNKDGTWRSKRNVADALVASVTAELRARFGTPGAAPGPQYAPPAQQPISPPAPVAPPVQMPQQYAPPVQMPPMYQPPAPEQQPMQYAPPVAQPMQQPPMQYAPPAAPAPVAVAQPGAIDFGGFMQVLQRGLTTTNPATGTAFVDQGYIVNLVARISQYMIDNFGLPAPFGVITDIHSNPQAIAIAAQIMQADGRWVS